jgi:hypothetical protein
LLIKRVKKIKKKLTQVYDNSSNPLMNKMCYVKRTSEQVRFSAPEGRQHTKFHTKKKAREKKLSP